MAISQLRELLAKATPGPYEAELDVFDCANEGIVATICDKDTNMLAKIETGLSWGNDRGEPLTDADGAQHKTAWQTARAGQEIRDAQFIAATLNALPALLDVAEAAGRRRAFEQSACEHEQKPDDPLCTECAMEHAHVNSAVDAALAKLESA